MKVVVIGGGISGLARQCYDVHIMEKKRLGGSIPTYFYYISAYEFPILKKLAVVKVK